MWTHHYLNSSRLIVESEQDFPSPFQPYLLWSEGERVMFNEHFMDRGSRLRFALQTHDRDQQQQFEMHVLVRW